MRMIMRVSMPTEVANDMVREGTLGPTIEKLLQEMKPEAAYFVVMDGERTGLIVLDVAEPSDMVRVAEPFFLALDAAVEYYPAMTPSDLQKAGPHFERAVREFGG
jgi:hypothetical protein